MPNETKLQEMQRRLHVDKLQDDEKKTMLSKLQKAGGQVVDLETGRKADHRRTGNIARENASVRVLQTRKSSQDKDKEESSSFLPPEKNQEPPKLAEKPRYFVKTTPKKIEPTAVNHPKEKIPSLFTVLAHRFNCSLSWITNFSGTRFRESFVRFICQEYQNNLLALSNLLTPLYNGDLHAMELRKNLYTTGNLIEYELAFRIRCLYQAEDFSRLQSHISKGVPSSEESFKILYRPLYYMKTHSAHTKLAVSLVLRRYAQLFPKKITNDNALSKAEQALTFVWTRFYTETGPLMLYYWTKFCRANKIEAGMEHYLGVPNNLPPVGAMAEEAQALIEAQMLGADDTKDGADAEGEEEKALYPSPDITRGIEFILHKIDFPAMYNNFQAGRDLRTLFTFEDKLFYAYCILDCFDSEFSFLWSGSHVNFYVLSDPRGGRYDPKKELIQLNGRINNFYEQTNEYLRQYRSYNELSKSFSQGSRRLVQLDSKEKDLSRLSMAARQMLTKLLSEYTEQIQRILVSKGKEESTVGNWDEEIDISAKAGIKILSGYTVEEALTLIQAILMAAEWLLTKSDLSGMGISMVSPQVIPYDSFKSLVDNAAAHTNKKG